MMEHPYCPSCGNEIEIDDLDVDRGEVISCPECGVCLQVLRLAPIELEVIPDEEVFDWNEL